MRICREWIKQDKQQAVRWVNVSDGRMELRKEEREESKGMLVMFARDC